MVLDCSDISVVEAVAFGLDRTSADVSTLSSASPHTQIGSLSNAILSMMSGYTVLEDKESHCETIYKIK